MIPFFAGKAEGGRTYTEEINVQQQLLEQMKEITEEEKKILEGGAQVEKELYATGTEFTIDSRKMLERGQLITVRKHTRFVHFPSHRHTYVEVIYVCQGEVVNVIGDKHVVVKAGEILFLNQYTHHEILPSGEDDLAVNFIVLPEFFDVASAMIGRDNVLADFLVNILRQNQEKGEYLHFKVAGVLQIQNLMENMIVSLINGEQQNNLINQTTMGLLFMHLVESAQYVEMRVPNRYDNMLLMSTLSYIEQQYRTASLTTLCETLHQPMHTLSRMIKAQTGYNFTELLLRKRLSKAVQLLCDTDLPVNDVIAAVGYENASYFHRTFKEHYHMTPRVFRETYKKEQIVPM